MDKVFLHHDKATSHTSKVVVDYLKEANRKYGIKYQIKEDIPVKGADISPMDFFGFGYIKNKLKNIEISSLENAWSEVQMIWSNLPTGTAAKIMNAWKRRCRMVVKRRGAPIQHLKSFHSTK